jgi:4-aminobutyrate aminotransferase/(S)-3-amino-2-methylpropionate transaminase
VLIADEIQSGFCRTGDWFGCDHKTVVPDLITTAKGIADRFPLAGVTGRAEMMDAVHPGGLGGTFDGNPVACAAAIGAMETMGKEDLRAAARRSGHRAPIRRPLPGSRQPHQLYTHPCELMAVPPCVVSSRLASP